MVSPFVGLSRAIPGEFRQEEQRAAKESSSTAELAGAVDAFGLLRIGVSPRWGYEVLWTRVLTMILGLSTAQSLSIILIAFLFGLALGGAIASRFVGRWPDLLIAFGAYCRYLLGLFGHISIGAFGVSTSFHSVISVRLPRGRGYLFATATLVFSIALIPTCLMGLLFPLVGQLNVTHLKTLGTKIGKVYAVNSLGSIAGAFSAGFLLIPLLGTEPPSP